MQKNHYIDYNDAIDIVKNLKSLDSSKQSQIESILRLQNENISNNTLNSDIMQSLKQQQFNWQQYLSVNLNENTKYSNYNNHDEDHFNDKSKNNQSYENYDNLQKLGKEPHQKNEDEDGYHYDDVDIDDDDDDDDDLEDERYSNLDMFSIKSSLDKNQNLNFLDNVKENLEQICNSNNIKRKNTKKRWWTPEEVMNE